MNTWTRVNRSQTTASITVAMGSPMTDQVAGQDDWPDMDQTAGARDNTWAPTLKCHQDIC